jgi:hypothetical protein
VLASATSNLGYPVAVLVSFLALCSNVLLFHICNCLLMDRIILSRLSVGCLCNQVVLLLIVDLVEFA